MKKYFILGIVVLLTAIFLCLSLEQGSKAGIDYLAFYGTAKAGATVCAEGPCLRCTTADSTNWYRIYLPRDEECRGWYHITDYCVSDDAYWNGYFAQQVNLCVPNPPIYCECE
jgi:hypothetical protein